MQLVVWSGSLEHRGSVGSVYTANTDLWTGRRRGGGPVAHTLVVGNLGHGNSYRFVSVYTNLKDLTS